MKEQLKDLLDQITYILEKDVYPFLLTNEKVMRIVFFFVLLLGSFGFFYGIFRRNEENWKQRWTDAVVKLNRDFATREMNRYIRDYLPSSFSNWLDDNYKYSRFFATKLGRKSLFNTSWKWFIWSVVLSIGGGILTISLSKNLFLSLVVIVFVFIIMQGWLFVIRQWNYKVVADELIKFLNLLGNYSTVNTEMYSVFMQIAPHVRSPLSDCLVECCAEANNTEMNQTGILQNLCNKIEVPKFKEVIKSLEITTRYSGSFKDTVLQNRANVNNFIKTRNSIQKISIENGMSAAICFGILLVVMAMLGRIIEKNIFVLLFTTNVGIGVFVVMMACVLYFLKKIIEVSND